MKQLKTNILFVLALLASLLCLGFWFYYMPGKSQSSGQSNLKQEKNTPKRNAGTAFKVPPSQTRTDDEQARVQKMLAAYQSSINDSMRAGRAALDQDYAWMFAQLDLTPEEMNLLKNLLVELKYAGENAKTQVLASKNLKNAKEFYNSLVEKGRQEIKENIAALLGARRYEAFEYYENTLPQRAEVDKIGLRFSYEAEPLTNEQRELLIDILFEYSSQQSSDSASKKKSAEQGRAYLLKQASQFLSESQIRSLQKSFDAKK